MSHVHQPGVSAPYLNAPVITHEQIHIAADVQTVWDVLSDVTFGTRAVDAFSFEASDGGTLVREDESWEGLLTRLFRARMERTLRASLRDGLRSLKAEAERRAGAAVAA